MKINRIILAVIVAISFTGCEDKLLEYNENLNNPETIRVDVALTAAQYAQFDTYGGYNNTTGGVGTAYFGILCQHFAGNHANGVDADQYLIYPFSFGYLLTNAYLDQLKDYKFVIEAGTEEGSWHYVGIAKVLTALNLGVLTDVFGDIPWSEALDSENETPVYDSQQEIYATIQQLLDEGIVALEEPTSLLTVGAADLIFNGDLDNWIAVAYLLKARYANHLSQLASYDPDEVLGYVDDAKAAGMASGLNLTMPYEGTVTSRNTWYNFWENAIAIASKGYMDMLMGHEVEYDTEDPPMPIEDIRPDTDPRLEAQWDDDMKSGSGTVFVGYVGKPNGYGNDNKSFSSVGPEGFFGQKESDIYAATYAELLFIEAEAAYRNGDMARAATAHNEAVIENIDLVIEGDTISIAGLGTRYLNYITAHASHTAATISIEEIMTEKYKAMFTMEIESYVDVRRTDWQYPSWLAIPVTSGGNPVADDFIARVLYPQSELDNNQSNVPDVGIFDKVWWDQ